MKTRESKTLASLPPIENNSNTRDGDKSLLISDEAKVDEDETDNTHCDVTQNTRPRRPQLRARKTTQKTVLTPLQPLHQSPTRSSSPFSQSLTGENGLLWIGMDEVLEGTQSSLLEARLKDPIPTRRPANSKATRTSLRGSQVETSNSTVSSTNNNSHNHINNNLLREELRRKDEIVLHQDKSSEDDVLLFRVQPLEDSLRHLTDTHLIKDNRVSTIHPEGGVLKGPHRETRREKKARVKLKEDPQEEMDDVSTTKQFHTLVQMKPLVEEASPVDDKKRKKDDKNRRKKLKHLEEENLSKRLYDCRPIVQPENRSQVVEMLVGGTQSIPPPEEPYSNDIPMANHIGEEDRRGGVLRLKVCGECGARHSGGVCPFSRPIQRLPDKCPLPSDSLSHHPQNGVIVAPPHKDPVNLPNPEENTSEETWRSPQRPGSPGSYARLSLPVGLTLEMRPMSTPQDTSQEDSDDGGMIGMPQTQVKDIEVVVATAAIARYTQLGPVVGVPVKEKDIPDDFCMVNLWEVFGGEGKRYLSTVEPKKSNWTRYLRPAPDRDSANIVLVSRQTHDPHDDSECKATGLPVDTVGGVTILLVTTQDISAGEELKFWAHDPTLAWSRKKMEKTNCGGCNMRFSHPLYYRMHCSVFHDPNYSLTIRKYHCKVCGLAVLGKENIMRHAAEQHEGRGAYQCQFCKKFFLRLHSLDMHVTYSCSKNPARVFPLCDYCGKKFCQPQHLRSHQKRMHADMAEVLREFQCKLCFKILGSRAALQRHLKEVHHKVNKQDLGAGATCDRCGKMFQNKSNLKIHMLTHSGVKPFRCIESSCNAAFTTKQCLQFHYKKVHGYSGDSMPTIERCIPYTFDSYSGGLVADPDTGKMSQPPSRNSSVDTPTDVSSSQPEDAMQDPATPTDQEEIGRSRSPSGSRSPDLMLTTAKLPPAATLHGYVAKYAAAATRLVSKGSRKWMGDSLDSFEKDQEPSTSLSTTPRDIYAFEERTEGESPRKKATSDTKLDEEKPFRRESNASLLVEAALNVAESSLKGETRLLGTHDRLLSYSGAVNGATSSRYSPPVTISSSDEHLLPQETALSTHIKYTENTNDERGPLEYTLEREYDPRDLPEVMVVHEGVSSRELNDSLSHDFHEHLHSALEHLPSASATVESIQEIQDVQNLALNKDEINSETTASHSEVTTTLSSTGVLEPTLHVLDQLPVTQGLAVSLSTASDVGLDMTYKHYRLVPETSLSAAISHDQLLCSSHLDDPEGSIGLDTITSSTEIHTHQMSPRTDHMSEHIPLPELQPHDFRGLQTMRSPSRSPYLSPSHTPEESLRSYLISSESLRSPHSSDQGIDMTRNNVFIRTSDLPTISYRYQNELVNSGRTQVYEIERPSSHSVDLSLVGRTVTFTDSVRTGTAPSTIYVTDARVGSTSPTVFLTTPRDDLRQSLDLTVSRSEEGLSQDASPLPTARSTSPEVSPHHNVSPNNQLSPTTQLISYAQISPNSQISTHSELSPLPHVSTIERNENSSPGVTTTHDSQDSSSPTPGTSLSTGTPLPPMSRIISASPHSFYSARQQLIPASRQDIAMSLPTHIYTDSYVVTNAAMLDDEPVTPGGASPNADSTTSKDRSSPYLQYPSSPYSRYHQELSSPPSGFHYQYY